MGLPGLFRVPGVIRVLGAFRVVSPGGWENQPLSSANNSAIQLFPSIDNIAEQLSGLARIVDS